MGLSRAQRMIYREIPELTCRTGCNDCCGIVPWGIEELERVRADIPPHGHVVERGGIRVIENRLEPASCVFATATGCSVYERRPFMCRLYGTAPSEPRLCCPHGCRPRAPLPPNRAATLCARQQVLDKAASSSR